MVFLEAEDFAILQELKSGHPKPSEFLSRDNLTDFELDLLMNGD